MELLSIALLLDEVLERDGPVCQELL
jgi:hypothetical protein